MASETPPDDSERRVRVAADALRIVLKSKQTKKNLCRRLKLDDAAVSDVLEILEAAGCLQTTENGVVTKANDPRDVERRLDAEIEKSHDRVRLALESSETYVLSSDLLAVKWWEDARETILSISSGIGGELRVYPEETLPGPHPKRREEHERQISPQGLPGKTAPTRAPASTHKRTRMSVQADVGCVDVFLLKTDDAGGANEGE